ncbi:MAG: NYN domain-containing protein, partial [Planctomycetes bacterium]|nr:NYN domain-containing protein [Planctomycetota bacterium]
MKTYVYVDMFNLYYGALKGTPYRWLNIHALCRNVLKKYVIARVKCYGARISARPDDPDAPQRQDTYFRALLTIPGLEIVEGQFLNKTISRPMIRDGKIVRRPDGRPKYVEVVTT